METRFAVGIYTVQHFDSIVLVYQLMKFLSEVIVAVHLLEESNKHSVPNFELYAELAEKRHGLFNTCFKQCLKHMYFFNVFFQMYFFKKTDLSFFNPYMSLVL